jgi:pimeloyl-ACP methyl ester carboxylesterase/DNA-binding SARP family transcriptional activator
VLQIKILGSISVRKDGKSMALPASRKSRALIAYLAIEPGPHTRSALCDMFWELPDDPRASLRWSLSKLRTVLNSDDNERLLADRQGVKLGLQDMEVDYLAVRETVRDPAAALDDLAKAWEMSDSEMLEDCELSNQPDFMIWLGQQRNELSRMRFEIAKRAALAEQLSTTDRDRWAERWLTEAPFDSEAAENAVSSKRAIGMEAQAAQLRADLQRSFREAGLTPPEFSKEGQTAPGPGPTVGLGMKAAAPRQSIRFVQAKDKTSIAWASVGAKDNPPLIKAANWLNHLELDWEAPIWSPLFRQLAETFHLVRYDERGCGLSDWDVPHIDFESFVDDLKLVADASGLDKFPLLGISQGAAVSIEFAARYPERVSKLVLFGGYPCGWRHTANEEEVREREAVMVLTETGWGRDNPVYRNMFSQSFMPDATIEELSWFDEFQRLTTSPENAVRFLEAFSTLDVRSSLAKVQCPTLVVHSQRDQRIPLGTGVNMASQIPHAQFSSVNSSNHLLLGRELASGQFVQAVRDFLLN